MDHMHNNEEWIKRFNQQVEHLEQEFNSFLIPGTLQDYYVLQQDRQSGTLVLNLCADKALPKQIADALTKVFMETKASMQSL